MGEDDLPSYQFIIMIRRTSTGYSVDAPDVEGCVATGLTVEHAKQMMEQALTLHLEMMQESGERIPVPRKSIEFSVDEDAGEEFCSWVEVELPVPSPPSGKGMKKNSARPRQTAARRPGQAERSRKS